MKRSESEIDALIAELGGVGLGGLNPRAEQLRELVAADRDGPLQFLNLLAYHPKARYPRDHEMAKRGLSGEQAYALYGAHALEHVTRRGGRLILYNGVEQDIIGDGSGGWDQVAIMQYPNTEAFVDMIRDPDYSSSLVHRDAGLARTAVFVTRPLVPQG